jgi:hypothetical protein
MNSEWTAAGRPRCYAVLWGSVDGIRLLNSLTLWALPIICIGILYTTFQGLKRSVPEDWNRPIPRNFVYYFSV